MSSEGNNSLIFTEIKENGYFITPITEIKMDEDRIKELHNYMFGNEANIYVFEKADEGILPFFLNYSPYPYSFFHYFYYL